MAAPGLILAAPASGSGKTLVTLALLRAFARRGLDVAGAKAGPDYIDPGFHQAASGRASVNLDLWAMRPAFLAQVLSGIAADLVLCEGVMGLFDGAGARGDIGSTADLALASGWPIVLVIDAAGQSASVGAVLRGFATHRPGLGIAGVIFNRVASPRHLGMLVAAAAAAVPGVAIFGGLPRMAGLELPARHLGLVLAGEHPALDAFLDAAADAVTASLDLDRLAGLARRPVLPGTDAAGPALLPLGQRIAVARDAAFAFTYPHILEGWRQAGAEIEFFSPLADAAPSLLADAIYLPGGYPELHAGPLSAAAGFQAALRAAAARGALIYGECGGYMALGQGLIDRGGVYHAMAGLLPVTTSIAKPQRHLGYRQVLALAGPWRGQRFRAHEFHFASETGDGPAHNLWQAADADGVVVPAQGDARGRVFGAFIHLIDRAAP